MAALRKNGVWADSRLAPFRDLRERAKKESAPNGDADAGPLSAGITELFEELRIHQIELEMQNEELRLAQADLETSRARYFDLYELAPAGYVTLGGEGVIIELNLRATALLAATRAALLGLHFHQFIAADDQDAYYLSRRRLLKTGAPQFCELRLVRPNVPDLWARLEMSLGQEAAAQVCRIVIVDITERKLAELQLIQREHQLLQQATAMQLKEEELRRLLNEKETLLNEVHHRVKNNLQVVSSLLRMQSEFLKDPQAAAALRESQQRVVSMALIHERLYNGQHTAEIDFGDYAQMLFSELLYSYSGSANHVTGRLSICPVLLNADQAIPCGLILNELVTNALKYAYPQGKSGEVVVALRETAEGLVSLTVSDLGVGLPHGLDWQNSESMGLPIVDLLTRQLAGKLIVKSNPGTSFTVTFQKEGRCALSAGG